MQRAQPSAFLIVRIFCPPSESNGAEADPPSAGLADGWTFSQTAGMSETYLFIGLPL